MSKGFEVEPHRFIKYKVLPWPICVHCGLIYLKNDFTDWAVKHGCTNTEHPSYQTKRKVTNPFEN